MHLPYFLSFGSLLALLCFHTTIKPHQGSLGSKPRPLVFKWTHVCLFGPHQSSKQLSHHHKRTGLLFLNRPNTSVIAPWVDGSVTLLVFPSSKCSASKVFFLSAASLMSTAAYWGMAAVATPLMPCEPPPPPLPAQPPPPPLPPSQPPCEPPTAKAPATDKTKKAKKDKVSHRARWNEVF